MLPYTHESKCFFVYDHFPDENSKIYTSILTHGYSSQQMALVSRGWGKCTQRWVRGRVRVRGKEMVVLSLSHSLRSNSSSLFRPLQLCTYHSIRTFFSIRCALSHVLFPSFILSFY